MSTKRIDAKIKHIDACQSAQSQYRKSNGLEQVQLPSESVPEISLGEIDLTIELLGKKLEAPLMIAPMTGGMESGAELNRMWAQAAEKFGIAMGVGSQRLALEDSDCAESFKIRQYAPSIPIFANIGAAQLAKGWGSKEVRRAVEMIGADAIFIHLNPMQEACQGGDVDFSGICRAIEALCQDPDLDIPIWVREVGFGLSYAAAQKLVRLGVAGIDCAGAGGTSWSKVESMCASDLRQRRRAEVFGEWGIPTAQSIENVRHADCKIPLIATGGLRNGLDVARALYLGADVGAMARPMLLAAREGQDALEAFIEDTIAEIRMACFGMGVSDIKSLRSHPSSAH